MNRESTTSTTTQQAKKVTVPLVDRLDPAIGEATSGVGALLTELVRRTLRSGVQKIDEEMHDFVEEKIDLSVAERMPVIEDRAIKIAEETAQVTAYKECETLESKTRSEQERLASEIQAAEQRAQLAVQKHIAELEERAKGTAATYREQIKALQQRTSELETALQSAIQQEQAKREKAEKYFEQLLQQRVVTLDAKLSEESHNRHESVDALREEIRLAHSGLNDHLYKLTEQIENHVSMLEEQNRQLQERVAELEKPKGLKALWQKMRSKKSEPEQ